jgi:CubicO group peptidase (beta-lactamase class C family)
MVRTVLLVCGIAWSLVSVAFLARPRKRAPAPSATPHSARTPPGNAADAAPYDAIDRYVERRLHRLNVPGAALAIVEGGQIVHRRGFGRAGPGGAPPTPRTPFVLGSLTKSFTALAVMQLVEARKIEQDAPVQRYLPWFRIEDPRASAQITVRHLLNQTSALPTTPGWTAMADFDQSPRAAERQARALATLRLTRPVGSAFEYTNTNFDLLGLIVEAASGESYATYVQNHIFTPLDMRHSFTTRIEAQQDGMARGHRYWFAHPVAAPDLPVPRGSLASGQLISSAEDVAHYLIAQMNDGRYGGAQILSPAGVAEMHRPAVEVKQGILHGHYGMGWFIDDRGPTRIVWHDGVVHDFFAYMAILPERKQGIVLLLNADSFVMVPALGEFGEGVGSLLAGGRPARSRFGVMPWLLLGLPLIPALQIVGVIATLRQLRRWQREPTSRPSGRRMWALQILLPTIPNLLVAASPIALLASPLRRFLFLSAPDVSWLALISGSFAAIWGIVRTGLVLRTVRRSADMSTPAPRRAA